MSFDGRKRNERLQNSQKNTARVGSGSRFDTEPVEVVNRYNPLRDVACSVVKVPYGMIGVAGRADDVRSHEVHLDNKDGTGFIPRILRHAEQQPWGRWKRRQDKRETRSMNRIAATLLDYRQTRLAPNPECSTHAEARLAQ